MEIMVAMVIALLAMLVTMQVYSLFEGQKRSTTGSADAMNNGAIALYGLQSAILQSGYGVSSFNLLGCDVVLRGGVTLSNIAPVTINHASITGQDANTDTLLVVYGTGNGSPEGDKITLQPLGSTNIYAVATPTSFAVNDLVIAEPQIRPSPCSVANALRLDRVTVVDATAATVSVVTGVAGVANGTLFNLGRVPVIQAYAIRNGNLTVCDYTVNDCGGLSGNNGNVAIWVPIANNIVSMRAQYGRDTSATMDAIVDGYSQNTGLGVAGSGAPIFVPVNVQCSWARIPAISLALLARSAQPEKPAITPTTAVPTWAGSLTNMAGTPAILGGVPFVLSGTTVPAGLSWQNYRYKVFETTAAIRNISWKGVATGC